MKVPMPATDVLRVLVIDDNHDSADALAMLLSAWGFDARAAYGGEEGMLDARRSTPNCVICDLAMPGVTGYEVASRLRSDPNLSGTLLVALSAYAGTEFGREARRAGFDRYLIKPCDPAEVRALLDAEALRRAG